MTDASGAFWRQSTLCILMFIVGIVATLSWQNLPPELFSNSPGTAPDTIAAAPATAPGHGPVALLLVAISILTLALIGAGIWFASKRPAAALQRPIPESRSATQAEVAATYSTETTQADVAYAREQVERQLAELVGYVSRYLDDTNDQAELFATAQSNLAGAGTVEQVQEVIKLLIANNATARKNADELRLRLVEAQSESAKLRLRLSQAEELATVDGLTNLPNRRRFQDCLEKLVAACHREHTPLSLVMADLDHFKGINDKYGHLSGDKVLKTFAQLLSNGVRSTDIAARYGGEEFAIILPKTPLGSASAVAESLRRAVVEATWNGSAPNQRIGRVTASFGVAEIREDETIESLIDRADQKLYEAKHKGRNRVERDHTVAS